MIAREVEEVANDRVALWTRGVVVFGFRYPMNPKSHEDSTCERKDIIGWHRERSSRREIVWGRPSLKGGPMQDLGMLYDSRRWKVREKTERSEGSLMMFGKTRITVE